MLPRNRRPTPPGEILRYEFLEPLGLSQKELSGGFGHHPGASERDHPKQAGYQSRYGLPFSEIL